MSDTILKQAGRVVLRATAPLAAIFAIMATPAAAAKNYSIDNTPDTRGKVERTPTHAAQPSNYAAPKGKYTIDDDRAGSRTGSIKPQGQSSGVSSNLQFETEIGPDGRERTKVIETQSFVMIPFSVSGSQAKGMALCGYTEGPDGTAERNPDLDYWTMRDPAKGIEFTVQQGRDVTVATLANLKDNTMHVEGYNARTGKYMATYSDDILWTKADPKRGIPAFPKGAYALRTETDQPLMTPQGMQASMQQLNAVCSSNHFPQYVPESHDASKAKKLGEKNVNDKQALMGSFGDSWQPGEPLRAMGIKGRNPDGYNR